mgnify:CR=1 FL=1
MFVFKLIARNALRHRLRTLLTVLGPEAGWEFAEQHGIAALLSSPAATRCSRAWEAALGNPPFAPALEPHV